MLEKDIENLIAKYPQEFFPKENLTLKGQQVKIGSCYTDVIFTDKFDRFIIIEIKRGILTREASGQILEYYGLLKEQNPGKSIELILCANIIPYERRLFLERVGIECKELGLSYVQEIAKKYNYKFLDEKILSNEKIVLAQPKKINFNIDSDPHSHKVWFFHGNKNKFKAIEALSDSLSDPSIIDSWRVREFKEQIKKGDIAILWVSGGSDRGIYAIFEITSEPKFMPIKPKSEKYWIDQELKKNSMLRVSLKITRNLVNRPLLKTTIKNINGLEKLKIFGIIRGRTALEVSISEWEVIKKLI